MGAMDNDLNRCNHMLSSDRRCRSLIHTPGSPFCYFHANGSRKKSKPSSTDGAADRGLFQWLATHPLDSVTNVNHAINLITLFLAGKRISVRRADALLRLLRVAMKSVSDVDKEFDNQYRRRHWTQGQQFLTEIQPLLAAPVPPNPPDQPHSNPSPVPGPSVAPPPTLDSSRTGSQLVLHPPELEHRATRDSQSVPAPSSIHNAADSPSPPPPVPAPAAPARAPQAIASPQANVAPRANASPHSDPLAPLVEKHLPSIIRALLSDADFDLFESPKRPASAGRNPRTVSASSDGSRETDGHRL